MTYCLLPELHVVRQMRCCEIVIVEGNLSLQVEFVKLIKERESKDSARAIERRGEPSIAKELPATSNILAKAIVNVYRVNSTCVENGHDTPNLDVPTGVTPMPKLDSQTQVFECRMFK